MKVTIDKNCYCHTCKKRFHYLGITRHRAMHRDKNQDCIITYTHGDTYHHNFSNLKIKGDKPELEWLSEDAQ